MRIKFGNSIRLCTNIALTGNLLIITNSNGVYTVDAQTKREAECVHNFILQYGYYDLSKYDYSNR